jgi:hypothetical protein
MEGGPDAGGWEGGPDAERWLEEYVNEWAVA